MSLNNSKSGQAFKDLYDEFFHKLVFSAFRYINSYEDSEEIVQDVFVKVWQNFDKIQEMKNLKSYLFKSVKNSSLNYLKHHKTKEKYIIQSKAFGTAFERSYEQTILEEETKQKIHRAINELPSKWREAFLLSKYNRLKYYEIAEEMNISQKTVEKYISKAFQFLRLKLKDVHFSWPFWLVLFS